MVAFTWTPSEGSDKDIEPRVKKTPFGDGYVQRVGDGINTTPRQWNLQFSNLSQSMADAIEAFLIARNGVESFTWTDSHGYAGVWIAPKWKRTPRGGTVSSISVTFEEVFGE